MAQRVPFLSFNYVLWIAPALLLTGCVEQPTYFPTAPIETLTLADGRIERAYDADGDGVADHAERLSTDGRVDLLRFDTDGDGRFDSETIWPACDPSSPQDQARPHLVIVLDSICYDMVEQAYLSGRFRLFTPPCRTVPPFPVMTDLCLAELFDCSPSTAVETEYYDGQKLVDGWSTYGREANSRWLEGVDVFSPYSSHAHIYTHADRGYDEELRQIETAFLHDRGADLVTYVVASSALGAANGRNGHASGLVRLDRFCQSLIHRCRGRVNITLLSDHGHYFTLAKYVDLDVELRRLGYRVTQRLSGPTDVVVPAFGMVTYAGLYTRSPSRVARDLLGIEGVEITSMRDADGDVHVFSRDGAARIRRREGKFRYHCDYGDPLQLKPIFSGLNENGRVDADGFVDDRTLFEAAHNHLYPDAIARLYRAFNGLVEHTPDVLVSFSEGRFWGSPFMSAIYDLHGSHGNLNLPGSSGFVMTTAGALPKVMRIAEVSEALKGIGAPIRSRKQAGTATPAKRK